MATGARGRAGTIMSMLPPLGVRGRLTAGAAITSGLLGGLASAGLLALINKALAGSLRLRTALVLAFIALVLVRIGAIAVSRLLLNDFVQRLIAELSRNLSRRVLATPLSQLEQLGIPRVLATLTDDVAMIGAAAQSVREIAMSVALLSGAAAYLGWLSWRMLLAVALLLSCGALGYRMLIGRAYRYLRRARDRRDDLFQHFRALTEGMKELKLHRGRRAALISQRIVPVTEALRRDTLAAIGHHTVADAFNQLVFYGLICGLFVLPSLIPNFTVEARTGYVLVMLYLMTPLWNLMDRWSALARARVALEKVHALGLSLAEPDGDYSPAEPLPRWQRLDLERVTFAYADPVGGGFVLGPLDFSLSAGELVFVVGGNGSGKSTFVKLLTGLYSPLSGTISLDGELICDNNREFYSRHFSAVFSDFYLFDSLLGLRSADLEARAHACLIELELDTVVQVHGDAFSTTALSQGQRKRLALLTAFLEDRPIYIFDEWTADQDPHYREIFYTRLLPELRSRGKTIIVVTHDDRHYHLGDRVVRLEYGKVAADTARPCSARSESGPRRAGSH